MRIPRKFLVKSGTSFYTAYMHDDGSGFEYPDDCWEDLVGWAVLEEF